MKRFTVMTLVVLLFQIPGFSQAPDAWTQPSNYRPLEVKGQPLKGLRVALDVGHSLASPGALNATGVGEFYFNAATAGTIARGLESAGATVILINGDGQIAGLPDRAVKAMKSKADCFISIHHDSVNQKYKKQWMVNGREQEYADDFRGYSVFASSLNNHAEASRGLALQVGAALYESNMRPTLHHNEPIEGENKAFINEETGVYEFTNLVVLKSSLMPAILLECGVIVHREEEQLVKQEWYQEMIARALVKALALSKEKGVVGKRKGNSLFGGGFFKGIFSKEVE
ncbi:MAG: N-acetylmuramoyl-L-alanine amidase [Verrucomicrobiales bacterium]|nr:N-acetylmuramoyl-L-alanine amidase [Verrucomicrobiales bacterium]